MNNALQNAILAMAKEDASTTKEQLNALAEICRGQAVTKKKLITSRMARSILGEPEGRPLSRPTLRRYVKEGKLHEIRLSARKIRFDENEIINFSMKGIHNND